MPQPASLSMRERAEMARSDVEAALTADESLHISSAILRRYAQPSADAYYPLE